MSLTNRDVKYASQFLRGLHSEKDIFKSGETVRASCFSNLKYNPFTKLKELSINWQDDCDSCKQLLNQKRDEEHFRFEYGYVVLNTDMVEQIATFDQMFGFNRAPIDDENEKNQYHGNLVFVSEIDTETRNMIICSLAGLCVSRIEKRQEIVSPIY